ncbi:MAG: T9SS type A sorting domain-containing protein [Saprospiraceae bacterium]|nr:T9SS type A sorting domain-containing protein [Saprospiraceae bacterium]
MRLSPPFLLTLMMLLIWLLGADAQSVRSYKSLRIKQGDYINLSVESEDYPIILGSPSHGIVDKFKLNFESQFRIRYQPFEEWVGIDTLVFQTLRKEGGSLQPFFEAYILEVAPIIAADDYFVIDLGDPNQDLDLLLNDFLNSAEAKIDRLAFVSQGSATLNEDSTKLSFSPIGPGHATITYVVKDGSAYATAKAFIHVYDDSSGPQSDTSFIQMDKDEVLTLAVPPGFNPPTQKYYSGVLALSGDLLYEYRPGMGYSGTEELKFVRLTGGKLYTQLYVIEVVDPFALNGVSYPDAIFTEQDNGIDFSVLENDIASSMESFDARSLQGQLRHFGGGHFRYRPPTDWEGQTEFTYICCYDGRCDEERVSITVFNYPPRTSTINVVTSQNEALHMPYLVPIDDFRFEEVLRPVHGILDVSADGKTLAYRPDRDFVGRDDFTVDYCTINDGQLNCDQVQVHVLVEAQPSTSVDCGTACVWPGDMNADGEVNVGDILPLGVNLGKVGPSRKDQGFLSWSGKPALPWENVRSLGGHDLKHVDANGDGSISKDDISVLSEHYAKAHTLSAAYPPAGDVQSVHVELVTPEVQEGDWATVQISIATNDTQDEIMGLSFSIELNEQFVNSNTFTFDLQEPGVFAHEGDVMSYTIAPDDGQYDIGIVSITGQAVANQGIVGQVSFIIEEDLNGFRSLKDVFDLDVFVKNLLILKANGGYQNLPTAKGTMLYRRNIDTKEQAISFYPNPAKAFLVVDGGEREIKVIRIFDNRGRLQVQERQIKTSLHALNLNALTPGNFFLQVLLDDGSMRTEQIEIF